MKKETILKQYELIYNDYDLRHIEAGKENIETVTDLIKWLDMAISHNYYTGHYWSDLYNYNNELEEIVTTIISDNNYLSYLIDYSDRKGDIFLLVDSEETIKYESNQSEIVQYVLNTYDEILTPEQFNRIIYYDNTAVLYYIDELYQIPEHLESFINYSDIIYELTQGAEYTEAGHEGLIFDENQVY